jgi:hypothetical protein
MNPAAGGRLPRAGSAGDPRGISVTPVTIFAHAKGDPFGQTRHRFGT